MSATTSMSSIKLEDPSVTHPTARNTPAKPQETNTHPSAALHETRPTDIAITTASATSKHAQNRLHGRRSSLSHTSALDIGASTHNASGSDTATFSYARLISPVSMGIALDALNHLNYNVASFFAGLTAAIWIPTAIFLLTRPALATAVCTSHVVLFQDAADRACPSPMEGKPSTATNIFPATSLARVAVSSQLQTTRTARITSASSRDAFMIKKVVHIFARTIPVPYRAVPKSSSTCPAELPCTASATSAPSTGATTKPGLPMGTAQTMGAHTDHATASARARHLSALNTAAGTMAAGCKDACLGGPDHIRKCLTHWTRDARNEAISEVGQRYQRRRERLEERIRQLEQQAADRDARDRAARLRQQEILRRVQAAREAQIAAHRRGIAEQMQRQREEERVQAAVAAQREEDSRRQEAERRQQEARDREEAEQNRRRQEREDGIAREAEARTALYSFKPAVDRGVRIVAMLVVQECADDGCNRGHSLEVIKEEFVVGVVDVEWRVCRLGGMIRVLGACMNALVLC
ncbi:hypothetical protein VM1G_11178 [Cytospora mali]|uniref:Uncharacterized protein n=1 Tax=Cytospora mali TaxID=578113 RepID=A0A194VK44_CYTMA|nr:hypothetical protein VM1G_11178 [Valsa mali]